jgi:hypothetical protein
MLLFASLVELTPEPISINQQIELRLDAPVTAITPEPMLEIRVPALDLRGISPLDVPELVKSQFGHAGIVADLCDVDSGECFEFSFMGHYVQDKQGVKLLIEPVVPVSTRAKFDFVRISTDTELESVSVYWKNSGKK